ncbi:hypothetical protein SAMN02744124_03907, partial [Paenibacillus barengoltzii J12]
IVPHRLSRKMLDKLTPEHEAREQTKVQERICVVRLH